MEINEKDYLEHYGVKGMRWGTRKGPADVSRRTNKDAAKDAKEFARAKAFYGEGAGTRRKLIKQTVEAKSKKDPAYAKAFEQHLNAQDQSKHVSKAKAERKRKNVAKTTKQTTGAIARKFTGEMGTTAAFTAIAIGGIAYMNSPKARRFMNGKINSVKNELQRRQGARYLKKKYNL